MSALAFEWDEEKNRSNQRKHGISFERASEVFRDPWVVIVEDRVTSDEERWNAIGTVDGILLLTVAHTLRGENGEVVLRLISARPATGKERRRYGDENG